MIKMHLIVGVGALGIAMGCKPAAGQGAAAPDETGGVASDGSGDAVAPGDAARAVDFDGERYALGRAYVRGNQTINEYYRPGESVASWQKVITVSDSRGAMDLKAFVKAYTDSLNTGLAVNKDVYDYGADTKIVASDVVAADRTELAMLRAVQIPNVGIRSYLFVTKIPSADKSTIAAQRAKHDAWMTEITAIDTAPVAP